MDPKILAAIQESMPRFNTDVTDSFHKKEFDEAVRVYERNLRMTLKTLEPKGVKFHGLRSVRPDEMFKFVSEDTTNKTFEINKESLYPVKLIISYTDNHGTEHFFDKVYVMLAYADKYGDVYIRDSLYSLQIVLADRSLSVITQSYKEKDTTIIKDMIFVKILGYKFKIDAENLTLRKLFPMDEGYHSVNVPLNLPANRFYTPKETWRIKSKNVPQPLLAWYVFAQYGVTEAISRFTECEFAIGNTDAIVEQYHSKDRWEIFTNSGVKNDKQLNKNFLYCDYAIAIRSKNPKRKEIPNVALQYAAAIIFLYDTAGSIFDMDLLDNQRYWRLVVGLFSMSNHGGEDNILKQMGEHFTSIYEYLDEYSIKKFSENGIVVKDMYDLLNYIVENRTEIIKTSDRANMFHKELASLEYTMDRLIVKANRFKHEIKNTTDLNKSKVGQAITRWFGLRDIEGAARESNLIQEATPTDCPLADYGLGVITQAKACTPPGTKRPEFNVSDQASKIHASLPFVVSYERITKPDPDGRGFLNPMVHLNQSGCVILAPHLRDLYERTNQRLTVRQPRISKGKPKDEQQS